MLFMFFYLKSESIRLLVTPFLAYMRAKNVFLEPWNIHIYYDNNPAPFCTEIYIPPETQYKNS